MKRAASPSEETYAHYKNKGLELYQHCPYHELKLRYGYQARTLGTLYAQ